MRLGGVLHDDQIVARGNLDNWVHVRHLPVQVHRYDGLRPRCDAPLDLGNVDGKGVGINIDVDRYGPSHHDRFGGRKKRVGDRDHLIARTHSGRA